MTLQENRSGGASRRVFGFRLIPFICGLFLSIVQACTIQSPRLNTHFLPAQYTLKTDIHDSDFQKSNRFKAVLLNDNKELNNLIIQFWKSGAFNELLATEHPYLKVSSTHIEAVEAGLNKIFRIYYLSGNFEPSPGLAMLFKPEDYSRDCHPLSNHEIQFMLNKHAESAFSTIALTMMIISSHELLQQYGAKPVYPTVSSAFLRRYFNLPELKRIQDYNLFATKHSGRFRLNKSQGFVFCRKIN